MNDKITEILSSVGEITSIKYPDIKFKISKQEYIYSAGIVIYPRYSSAKINVRPIISSANEELMWIAISLIDVESLNQKAALELSNLLQIAVEVANYIEEEY